jgi:hypothetical protein
METIIRKIGRFGLEHPIITGVIIIIIQIMMVISIMVIHK